METYELDIWSQMHRIRADWRQSSDSIEAQYEDGEWTPTGWQVADFQSPEDAMRAFCLDGEADDEGRIPTRALSVDTIAARITLI
tara:strand:+ start:186 stop:440 length:255 start_codon:yes stop_codon:yes gene_type:complete